MAVASGLLATAKCREGFETHPEEGGLDFGPHQVGVQTYCFHDLPIEEMLEQVTRLRLRYVEVFEGHVPFTSDETETERLGSLIRQAGVTPVSVYTHAFSQGNSPREVFEFARSLGVEFINAEHRPEVLSAVSELIPEFGIGVSIHNHGPGTIYDQIEDVEAVLDRFESLTTCIDIGHYARSGVSPVEAVRRLGHRAVEVHVKDIDESHENAILGEGIIDLPGVFAALRQVGFDGLLALEHEGDWDDLEARLEAMHISLQYMRRLLFDSAKSA